MLIRLDRETARPGALRLRAWLDQFNHRLLSLFYRAWEKYRFFISLRARRGLSGGAGYVHANAVQLRRPGNAGAARTAARDHAREVEERPRERVLAEIDDLALLYYGGLLAQRPRTAVGLAALLRDYFDCRWKCSSFTANGCGSTPKARRAWAPPTATWE